jgi:hypothetical protein
MSSLPSQNFANISQQRSQSGFVQQVPLNQQAQVNVVETEQVVDVQERRVTHNTNIFGSQPRSIVDTQKHLATEIPITTEKQITTEYVPVTMEKIIQRIPVVVGQRVQTGVPLQGQTEIQAMGVQYVQQQVQTEVDLIPEMHTRVGQMECVQQQVVGGNQIITQSQPIQQGQLSQAQLLQNQQFNLQNQQFQNQQFQNQQFGHVNQQLSQQLNQAQANQLHNQQLLNQQMQNQQFQNQQFQNQQLFGQSTNLLQTQQQPAIVANLQSPHTTSVTTINAETTESVRKL